MDDKRKWNGRDKEAYDLILNRILSGELESGDMIPENALTKQLNSSRTPIREALVALENDGLVKRIPNRGWFVAETTTQDIEEIFDLRKLLETHALSTSIKIIPREDLEALRDELIAIEGLTDEKRFFYTDRTLHRMIVSYSGNSHLSKMLNTLNMQVERLRFVSARKPSRLALSRVEHLNIVNAMLEGDLAKAQELLGKHIDNIRDNVILLQRFNR